MTVNKEYQKLADKLRGIITHTGSNGDYVIDNRWTRDSLEEVAKTIELLGSRPQLSPRTAQFIQLTDRLHRHYVALSQGGKDSLEQALGKFGLVAGLIHMDEKLNQLAIAQALDSKQTKEMLLAIATQALQTAMWLDDNFNTSDR